MKDKKERSEMFKRFQKNIKRKSTFEEGKKDFFILREELKEIQKYIFSNCKEEDFSKMPLKNDKTIAYYLYHMTRIEDITSNTLIKDRKQIFFENKYNEKLNSSIITTGNEIKRDKLEEFSKLLNINELENYVNDIFLNTNEIVATMDYEKSKKKVSIEKKNNLISLNTVSTDEDAVWLIEYWCKKTNLGLVLMPFSRHLMLHLDGCLRIMKKLKY